MFCPFCRADDTKVIDSRLVADGSQVKRRRECGACHERFTTFEAAELVMPRIVKRDGSRELTRSGTEDVERARSSGNGIAVPRDDPGDACLGDEAHP